MRHVLWIEDEATFDLNRLAAAVNVTFRYKLTIAKTVTDALRHLQSGVEYEAVIVDMRLLPGDDPRWAEIGDHADHALLGKELILALLQSPKTKIRLAEDEIPKWIGVERFAVFTVEPEKELSSFLTDIGMDRRCYQRKKASLEQTTLLTLIETVIRYSNGQGPNGHHHPN